MRIVIIGDKSRYQFLRHLVSSTQNDLQTEYLLKNSITVLNSSKGNEENVFYSHCIPLGVSLYFPSDDEINFDLISYSHLDKILIFDEFPYRTASEVESLEKNFYQALECQVVIVVNKRVGISTDLDSEENEAKKAQQIYEENNISTCIYDFGKIPDFLFYKYNRNEQTSTQLRQTLDHVRDSVLNDFKDLFDIYLSKSMEDSIITISLSKFFEYRIDDEDELRHNALMCFINHAFDEYLGSRKTPFVKFYESLYRQQIAPICYWNLEVDLKRLYERVVQKFCATFYNVNILHFEGDELDFYSWKHKNKESINEIQKKINYFLHEDIRELLYDYLVEKIGKVESLLNEKI